MRKAFARQGDIGEEHARYEAAALIEYKNFIATGLIETGVEGLKACHIDPYLSYYAALKDNILDGETILELGAGSGRHTSVLAKLDVNIVALDISQEALKVLALRVGRKIDTICANMEQIPLQDSSVDWVVSVGSLSYGNWSTLCDEIQRVLKPGGSIIFLDSLNHNVIYKFNRFIHFLRGYRTFSTLIRMPKKKQLDAFGSNFKFTQFRTCGVIVWLVPILQIVFGEKRSLTLLRLVDRILKNQD